MRKYLVKLLIVTLLLVIGALALMMSGWENYQTVMPFIPLYFAVVTGVEHWTIVESMRKSPRTFVKNFLGVTVGVLFVHLAVMSLWMFTHVQQAKWFAVAFCICYAAHLFFETIALVVLMRNVSKKNEEEKKNSAE